MDEQEFYARLADVRKAVGDRAVLRAMHFFDENRRVQMQVRALKNDNFAVFLNYVNESGNASWELLQNITPLGATAHQEMAFTLALCRKLLGGEGAVRVHGGGFAGTVLAFVPNEQFEQFKMRWTLQSAAAVHRSCIFNNICINYSSATLTFNVKHWKILLFAHQAHNAEQKFPLRRI